MDKKYRLELFAFYDHTGIANHLEKMAAKGWLLEEIGPYFWTYRKTEPQKVRFSVVYQADLSVLQRDFSEKQQLLRDYCKLEGWVYTASKGCMQVFRNTRPDPVPIETDAVMQVAAINEAAWKTHLRLYWTVSGLALFLMMFWFMLLTGGDAIVWPDPGWMVGMLATILFLAHGMIELAAYYLWYEKAEYLAKSQGILHPTKSRRGVQIAVTVFSVLLVCSQQTDQLLRMVLRYGSFLVIPVILGTVAKKLAERLRLSSGVRNILAAIVCIIWIIVARYFWSGHAQ